MHQLAHHGQADAAALALGGKERREDVSQQMLRHAGAVVAHFDAQAPAARQPGADRDPWRRLADAGFGRVLYQVDQRLFQLAGIGHQCRRRRVGIELGTAAARLPGRCQQCRQARKHRRHGNALRLRLRHAGQRAVAADEMGQAVGTAADRVQRDIQILGNIGRQLAAHTGQQLARCVRQRGHWRERIHDFMRQHMYQLLPRLHGFGFQLMLHRHQRDQPLWLAFDCQCAGDCQRTFAAMLGIDIDHAAPACHQREQCAAQCRHIGHTARCQQAAGVGVDCFKGIGSAFLQAKQGDGGKFQLRLQRQSARRQRRAILRQADRALHRRQGRCGPQGGPAVPQHGQAQQRRQGADGHDCAGGSGASLPAHAGAECGGHQQDGASGQHAAPRPMPVRVHVFPASGTAPRGSRPAVWRRG